MAEIIEIGITGYNNKKIIKVPEIEAIAGKGILGDRHYKDFNDPFNQLSIIESENIDEYNEKYNLKIPYLEFRRNIVSKKIKLNDLIGKKLLIGDALLEVIDLCRPCRHLSEKLKKDNIIKEFLRKGGIRCSIINNGKICVGDQIKII